MLHKVLDMPRQFNLAYGTVTPGGRGSPLWSGTPVAAREPLAD